MKFNLHPSDLKDKNQIWFNGMIINEIFLKENLIGYVVELRKNVFSISPFHRPFDLSGDFIDFEEAKKWLIERYEVVKWPILPKGISK